MRRAAGRAAAGVGLALLITAVGAAANEPPLRVHIVPHTHDDSGWLKTVDQYYWGDRQDIQVAGVQYILDAAVAALERAPARRFVYAEVSFFSRWWARQTDERKAAVRRLVQEKRLDFVNGGYVQHDEAGAHYASMVDQTTRGHAFLRRELGVVPRVGWQIDPFGHSATQAALLSAGAGFDALFFGRADYQDMAGRKNGSALEMVWRAGAGGMAPPGGAEPAESDAYDVFAGNFISGNYGPPPGFNWEWALRSGRGGGGLPDPPMIDDPASPCHNVAARVDDLVAHVRSVAAAQRGRDVMLTMGSDFHYAAAEVWFTNLDRLIAAANADGRVHAFYSTPAEYAAAKHAYGARWPLRRGDFFPYADHPHAYWTGYFASRPASKGYVREAAALLQAARQLEALAPPPPAAAAGAAGAPPPPSTDALEEAVALLQHHDAVTGTAKQHVVNDYHRRLAAGVAEARGLALAALGALISGGRGGGGAGRGAAPPPAPAPPLRLEACAWLNATVCGPSVSATRRGEGLLVAAYNPLGWARAAAVRVPVSTKASCGWAVAGPAGEAVDAQLVPAPAEAAALQALLAAVNATGAGDAPGDAELVFVARLPPLGYKLFAVVPAGGGGAPCAPAAEPAAGAARRVLAAPGADEGGLSAAAAGAAGEEGEEEDEEEGPAERLDRRHRRHHRRRRRRAGDTETLSNGLVELEFCARRGVLLRAAVAGADVDLSVGFGVYNASDGLDSDENRGQASGAYVFRPVGAAAPLGRADGAPLRTTYVRGAVVSEARQVFADWATLTTRLYAGAAAVEFEWTVGPVPHGGGLGREVVLRYSSSLASGDALWTDSNGREMLRRVRDARPEWAPFAALNVTDLVAGNYYPITSAAALDDGAARLSLLTERAQGAASLAPGALEVMVHRRLAVDDRRGVGEALNETACGCSACACPGLVARGVHWVTLAPSGGAAVAAAATLATELNDRPLLGFGAAPAAAGGGGRVAPPGAAELSLSGGAELQPGVHLMTLKALGAEPCFTGGAEACFLVRLASLLQGPGADVTQDLAPLVAMLGGDAVLELSLTGNQRRADVNRLRFEAEEEGGGGARAGGRTPAPVECAAGCSSGPLLVALGPLEIRTFEVARTAAAAA